MRAMLSAADAYFRPALVGDGTLFSFVAFGGITTFEGISSRSGLRQPWFDRLRLVPLPC
jgi:hypothetical protein